MLTVISLRRARSVVFWYRDLQCQFKGHHQGCAGNSKSSPNKQKFVFPNISRLFDIIFIVWHDWLFISFCASLFMLFITKKSTIYRWLLRPPSLPYTPFLMAWLDGYMVPLAVKRLPKVSIFLTLPNVPSYPASRSLMHPDTRLKQEEERRKREELERIVEENNKKIEEAQRKLVSFWSTCQLVDWCYFSVFYCLNRRRNVWPWWSNRGKWRRIDRGCSVSMRSECVTNSTWSWAKRMHDPNYPSRLVNNENGSRVSKQPKSFFLFLFASCSAVQILVFDSSMIPSFQSTTIINWPVFF